MTLNELADQVEKAEGPSYALDCAIWDAIYPGERQHRFDKLTAKGQPYHGRLGPADLDGYVKPLRAFTASIDAAMTLILPHYRLGTLIELENGARPWAAKLFNRGAPGGLSACGAETPALALCAAALRARAVFSTQENHDAD